MNFKVANNIKDLFIQKSINIMGFIINLEATNMMDFIINLEATNIKGFASILHFAKNKVLSQWGFSSITTLKFQASYINLAINFHIVVAKTWILVANSISTLAFQVISGKGCIKGSCLGSCMDFNLVA
jgi:hypothetical protein